MNPEIKQKWLEALRSGEYEQGQHSLEFGGRYCCLGVLRHCIDPNDTRTDGGEEFLSDSQLEEFGLIYKEQLNLAEMNDNEVSFNEIADYIEITL